MEDSNFQKTSAVIDIGNTNTRAGLARAGQVLGSPEKIFTRDLIDGAIEQTSLNRYLNAPSVLAACVVPAVRAKITARFPHVQFLDAGLVPSSILNFSAVDTSTLGGDRIANALAALQNVPEPPVIVMDCGTAITLEVVDRNRCFRGGAVWPGREMQRKSLQKDTGSLPGTTLNNDLPAVPAGDTETAIQAGVDGGLIGAAKELLNRLLELPEFAKAGILITGGDGPFFAGRIPQAELMPEDFTLQGIAALISATA